MTKQLKRFFFAVFPEGDRRQDIFHDEVDRQEFLKTLSEACAKADFQVHAYCLMSQSLPLGAGDAQWQFGRGDALVAQQ